MTLSSSTSSPCGRYQLQFEPLLAGTGPLAFECSADGRVELDALSRPELNRYLYARALVGRTFHRPAVALLRAG